MNKRRRKSKLKKLRDHFFRRGNSVFRVLAIPVVVIVAVYAIVKFVLMIGT